MTYVSSASHLDDPKMVMTHLRGARSFLTQAHKAATEHEGELDGLNGPVRDLLFGLNTAVDSLILMIQEGRFS